MTGMSRWFIGIGIALIVLGLLWPWIQKSGLGRLPGDIIIEKEGFRFYFPITSMIIISLGLSLIIWIFRK